MTPDNIDALLSEDRRSVCQRWQSLYGTPPPSRLSRPMMAKILVVELQWRASGQSRAAMMRRLQKAVAAGEGNQPLADAGKRLIREWHGRQYVVDVVEDGYLWEDRVWSSLSAIAKEITGAKWSGPRFFGVAR